MSGFIKGRNISEVPSVEIKLPIKSDGEIDFEFMSNFTKKLQYANFM